jgi:hypothetical protein
LEGKLQLHWRHHGWIELPKLIWRDDWWDNLEKTSSQRYLPHSLSGEDATTQLSLLRLSTRISLRMSWLCWIWTE